MLLKSKRAEFFTPAVITLTFITLVISLVIVTNDFNPLELAVIGSFYATGEPNGTAGYDGQFVYYIARDPDPSNVIQFLDVPAYRYQRILFPLAARLLSLGNIQIIPWMIPVLGILVHTLGTLALSGLLIRWGSSGWYALSYGLWVGILLAIRLDLPEPLAFALVIFAIVAYEKKHDMAAAILLALAVFAKEVTILFVIAALLAFIVERRWHRLTLLLLFTIAPFIIFQFWLKFTFGQFGLASGGYQSTPFEIVPFMGLVRISESSVFYMLMMALAFFPCTIFPAIWSVYASIKSYRLSSNKLILLMALINALAIFFIPFSTFRETGGLLRISTGLILGSLLLVTQLRETKLSRYSFIWIIYNLFLFK